MADLNSVAPQATQANRRTRTLLLIVVPAIALAIAAGVYLHGGRYVETDNAYVKADKIPVSAEVSGTVREVLVSENEKVAAGQLLFRLDDAPFKVAVAKAEAKLAQVRTDLSALQASYYEKQAEIALAHTRLAFARHEQQRQADLIAKHYTSAATFDDARQSSDIAAQQITVLEQDLRRIAVTLGGSADTPVEHHPAYLAALAELDEAKLDLARTEVHASLAGIISKPPKPGQYTAAGATTMALVVTDKLWVEANFTETDLTYVRPGLPVEIKIDTYPNRIWHGTVESLSPATGAEFSLLPAQNATGNWIKITQRVPVRIALDDSGNQPELRSGLSAIAEVDTGHRRQLLGISL